MGTLGALRKLASSRRGAGAPKGTFGPRYAHVWDTRDPARAAELGGKACWAGFWPVLAVLPRALARQVVLLHQVDLVRRMTLKLLQCSASNFRNMETYAFRETPPGLSAGVSV